MSTEGGTKAVVAALRGQPRHRDHQVRRLRRHRVELDALRGDPLGRRLRQPGAAAHRRHAARKREADEQHQFGYGRVRYVYAFVVSIVLFCLGGLFSLYEGWHKIHDPEELTSPQVAFVVLGIAIVLEALLLPYGDPRGQQEPRHASRWRASSATPASPSCPVVLLEDFGALVGLVFALFGVTLAVVTGDARWDGVGALAIGVAAARDRGVPGARDVVDARRRERRARSRPRRSARRSSPSRW